MSNILTIRSPRFRSALSLWLSHSKRSVAVGIEQQIRLFVRDVVRITPPNQGNFNKAAGEKAIRGDLGRIFTPQSDGAIQQIEEFYGRESSSSFGHRGAAPIGNVTMRILSRSEMAGWHQSRRIGNGRVMNVHRNVTTGLRRRDLPGLDSGIVRKADFAWYVSQVLKRLGLLASGWAPAAVAVGLQLPPWITRHGNANGSFTNVEVLAGRKVRVINRIRYAGHIQGLGRRVQSAADNRAVQMEKQVAGLIFRQSASRAGFKVTGGAA